jgi:epsin
LRAERRSRGDMRDRMLGNLADSGLKGDNDYGDQEERAQRQESRWAPVSLLQSLVKLIVVLDDRPKPARNRNEDDDLQKAIAESMRMQEDEATRRSQVTKEEDDFQRALRMSEEEEARRKREQEESNSRALFDDSLNL